MNGLSCKISLITLISFITTAVGYNYRKQILIPQGVIDLEFSPDQKYLLAVSDQYLQLYNGVTGNIISHIVIPYKRKFRAFSFSQDSSHIGLGYGDGDIVVLHQETQFDPYSGKIYEIEGNSPIKSLCFSADNKRLIFINEMNPPRIGVIDLLDDFANITYYQHIIGAANFIYSSPYRSEDFMVGGGISALPSLTLYKFDIQEQEISTRQIFTMEPGQQITCGTYSPQGSLFYAMSNDYTLFMINPYNYQMTNITLDFNSTTSQITKIRVNKELNMLALASQSLVFSVTITSDNLTLLEEQDLSQIIIQSYDSSINSVALGPNGGNLFYVSTNSMGEFLSQCNQDQYFNSNTNTCVACSLNCSNCLNSPNECYGCQAGYYLNKTICSTCLDYCSFCLGPLSCVTCKSSFTYKSGSCICLDGFYLDSGLDQCQPCPQNCTTCNQQQCHQCKKGFEIQNDNCVQIGGIPEWAIVIIVMVVVALVCSIFVGLSAHSKKKKQQRLLTEEHLAG